MPCPPSPDPQFVLRSHTADVQAICFTDERNLLYTGDAQGNLLAWNLQRRRPQFQKSIHLPEAGITSLHFFGKDRPRLLSQGRDGILKIWEIGQDGAIGRTPSKVMQTFSANFCRCVVSEAMVSFKANSTDLHMVKQALPAPHIPILAISGSEPSDIELWSLEEGRILATLSQPAASMKCGMCMALQFLKPSKSEACQHLLAGYEDGTLVLWDAADRSQPKAMRKLHGEPIMALATHDQDVFTGSAEDSLCKLRVDLATFEISLVKRIKLKASGVSDIAIRKDGRIFAAAGWDHTIRVFSNKTCAPLAVLQYHRKSVAALAFDNHTGELISAGRDGTVACWSIYKK